MAVRPLSAVLAISRNCFFKVVLSIFEGAKLARAIITTATTPYAIGIDSKIFRYFFGSSIISNGCLSALSRIGIGKTSMAETNRKGENEYALMHLRLRSRHGWMKAVGAFIGLPRGLRDTMTVHIVLVSGERTEPPAQHSFTSRSAWTDERLGHMEGRQHASIY
jgi:hypothetical protein